MKLKNKIIIVLIAALFVAFATLSAVHIFGTGEGASVKYPKGFTVIETADDALENEEFIEAMGYSTDSFLSHKAESNIVSFAANKDNSSQFMLIERSTDFSEQIYDISESSDKDINNIAAVLVKSGWESLYSFLRLGVDSRVSMSAY